MSLLEKLAPAKGSTKQNKRRGRGNGSGLGKTAGKGHKGQKARSGGRVTRGYEGGQMPIHRRLPKFGFNSPFRTEYEVVNLSQLAKMSGDVNPDSLKKLGIVHGGLVKILGNGELKKSLNVKAHKFSASAKGAIEAAGGKAEVIS